MKISLIAAMSENRVIGKDNQLPWHLPLDLKHFKALTLNKSVLMGRKTFESIGKPLPNRKNIILTRAPHFTPPGCFVAHDLSEAYQLVDNDELMVIGGHTLYEQTLNIADTLYITLIHAEIDGNIYFPKWDETLWKISESETHLADEKHPYPFTFLTYQHSDSNKRSILR